LQKYSDYGFVIILVLVFLFLGFWDILFLHPQGIHFIRQTDILSVVENYLRYPNFFEPHIYNLSSLEGKGASEFPILYYITAGLYSVFGSHEFFLRSINIIIVSTGFLYLFKTIKLVMHGYIIPFLLALFFLSSTVLLYYTNNFIPDAPALGFCLVGWFFAFRYQKEGFQQRRDVFWAFFFFTLSSLLKVTFFISPISFFVAVFLSEFRKQEGVALLVKRFKIVISGFFVSAFFVALWVFYVRYFNSINSNEYFLLTVKPLWHMNREGVAEVFNFISNYWYTKYYYPSSFHFIALSILLSFAFFRKRNRFLGNVAFWLLLGTISYVFLFYAQFKEHDYYFIAVIPSIIFVGIYSFDCVRKGFSSWYAKRGFQLILFVLVLLSLNYAKQKLHNRYNENKDPYAKVGAELLGMDLYLDQIGVSRNAPIVILGDGSPNGGLYFAKRSGWSIKDTSEQSMLVLQRVLTYGPEYLIAMDSAWIKPSVVSFAVSKIGCRGKVCVYEL
jgi:hypothetical protein